MGCVATLNVEVTYVATRLALRVAVTLVVLSKVKVITPVGVPAPGKLAVTVAVSVIGWPKTAGLFDETRPVVVLALLTVWLSDPELDVKVALPA